MISILLKNPGSYDNCRGFVWDIRNLHMQNINVKRYYFLHFSEEASGTLHPFPMPQVVL